ncbi:hypothetical protein JHD50_04940 [Sulfurimonas sp. MAG313]|nr:hypothetical protein [Sulfurimonas sp. MAG313]MDF1880655.1 hypothetical protein [Sulfurimonas sp. MAG313]
MLKKLFITSILLFTPLLQAKQNMFAHQISENKKYTKTIRAFMAQSSRMTQLVHKSYAHVVFPSIWKGSAVLGYAWGDGRAFVRGGIWTGNVKMTQYTAGVQVGVAAYKEIIFFKTRDAFERFKKGGLEDSNQISVVPFYSGLSADLNFDTNVEVYTSSTGGFMLEASTGLQSFEYFQKP